MSSTIDKSFLPVLDGLIVRRVERCLRDFDDELFACQYGLNASIACYTASHYLHGDNPVGMACKLHCLKATHDFLAAFQLARCSMHSQAANAARLACETSWQNAAFHQAPDLAARWASGQQIRPARVRAILTTFAEQRRFLYHHLSAIAHPNKDSMVALDPWQAGDKEVDPDALMPRYLPDDIARSLHALFVAQFLAQLDFDANHLAEMNNDQQRVFGVQAKRMAEYYRRALEAKLPDGLRGLTHVSRTG